MFSITGFRIFFSKTPKDLNIRNYMCIFCFMKMNNFVSHRKRDIHSGWLRRTYQEKYMNLSRRNRRMESSTCFILVSCFIYSSILKIEATCSSKMSVEFQQNTRRYIPEDRTLHNEKCHSFRKFLTYHFTVIRFTVPLKSTKSME
jgi:hypothetical protein